MRRFLLILALLALAVPSHAVATIYTEPLYESVWVWFKLDETCPAYWDAANHKPLGDTTNRAHLRIRPHTTNDWTASPGWEGPDFERFEADRYVEWSAGAGITPPDPRMLSVFEGLTEGTQYDYKVTFTGAQFPTATTLTGTFTTKSEDVPRGTGTVVTLTPSHFTSASSAKSRIETVLGAPYADYPGAVIQVEGNRDGSNNPIDTTLRYPLVTKDNEDWNWNGTAAGWITIRPAPGWEGKIHFDGSDPDKEHTTWTAVDDDDFDPDDAVYKITGVTAPPAHLFYEVDGDTLPWHIPHAGWATSTPVQTKADFVNRVNVHDEPAWYWVDADDTLYVRLHRLPTDDGAADTIASPNDAGITMKWPIQTSWLDMYNTFYPVKYVRVEGFKVRYFAARAMYTNAANNIQILDCEFDGFRRYIDHLVATHAMREDWLIRRCKLREKGLYPLPTYGAVGVQTGWRGLRWGHTKGHDEEIWALDVYGRRMTVSDCTFQGQNNQIGQSGGGSIDDGDANTIDMAMFWHVTRSDFIGATDDCLEHENYVCGVLYSDNDMSASYNGISVAPVMGGPVYARRNRFVALGEYHNLESTPANNVGPLNGGEKQHFVKHGNQNHGDVARKIFQNNTAVSLDPIGNGAFQVGLDGEGATSNIVHENELVHAQSGAVDWVYESLGFPHVFDYNTYTLYDPTDHGPYGAVAAGALFYHKPGTVWQGEAAGLRQYSSLLSWQKGDTDLGTEYNMPGYDGTVPTSPRSTGALPNGEVSYWLHDPHSTYRTQTAHGLANPALLDLTPDAGHPAINAGKAIANVTYDLGDNAYWTQYAEAAGSITVGAVPAATGTVTTVTVPSPRGRCGTTINLTVTAASTGTLTDLTFTCKDSGGVDVAGVTGTPVTIGGDGHSASVTLSIPLPATPGDLTITGTAVDGADGATGTGTVRVRRATSATVVAG